MSGEKQFSRDEEMAQGEPLSLQAANTAAATSSGCTSRTKPLSSVLGWVIDEHTECIYSKKFNRCSRTHIPTRMVSVEDCSLPNRGNMQNPHLDICLVDQLNQ